MHGEAVGTTSYCLIPNTRNAFELLGRASGNGELCLRTSTRLACGFRSALPLLVGMATRPALSWQRRSLDTSPVIWFSPPSLSRLMIGRQRLRLFPLLSL